MAKFCTECGKEIAAGMAFCTECGAPTSVAPARKATETVPEVKNEPKVEVVPEAPVYTPPAQSSGQQQTYHNPAQTIYTPPTHPVYTPPTPDPTSKVVGTGAYFGMMLLFALPIIGFIVCIIMAFAPKNKNIKHFARATLICMIISAVIIGILIVLISMLINALMDYINQLVDGQFSNFGELFSQLGDLDGLMEQIQNSGELETLLVE